MLLREQQVERAGRGAQGLRRDVHVEGRRFQVAMAEQQLNGAQVRARLEQMRGE